jgi:Uncharacterized protein conserved in bacteria
MTQTPSNGEPGAEQTPAFNLGDPVAPQAPDSSVPPPYTQPTYSTPNPYPPVAPATSAAGDTTIAAMAHWLGILIGFLGPLIIWLTKGEQDKFVKDHAIEALNFQITLAIGYVASFILSFVFIGIIGYVALPVLNIIFSIIAAMAANKGESYRYPFALRLIK